MILNFRTNDSGTRRVLLARLRPPPGLLAMGLVLIAICLLAVFPAHTQSLPSSAEKIMFGMSTALTGPARISGRPGCDSIVEALEGLQTFELGLGEPLTLARTEHQASRRVWPTELRGGKFIPLKWEELAVATR